MKYYNFLVLSILILFGFGCTSTNKLETNAVDPTLVQDQVVEQPVFDVTALVPVWAKSTNVIDLDLDTDGIFEKLVTYNFSNEAEVGPYFATRTAYLRVYRFVSDQWSVIKEDQIDTNTLLGFCGTGPILFENSVREYLFVSKCDWDDFSESQKPQSYYVFGEISPGVFDDLSIPKAYLHSEDYTTGIGEFYLRLEAVDTTPQGIVEHYGVACEIKPQQWTNEEGDCRRFDVQQNFEGASFSTSPIMVNEVNLLQQEPLVFDAMTVEVGEVFGAWTVNSVTKSSENSIASAVDFTGEMDIIGKEDWCISSLNETSVAQLPYPSIGNPRVHICFTNVDEAREAMQAEKKRLGDMGSNLKVHIRDLHLCPTNINICSARFGAVWTSTFVSVVPME